MEAGERDGKGGLGFRDWVEGGREGEREGGRRGFRAVGMMERKTKIKVEAY